MFEQQRIRTAKAALQDLAVAHNDAEKIVEVVGNSAGETPHRFHFLRHTELLLQYASFGDVLGEDFQIGHRTSLILYRPAAASHGNGRTVLALPLDFKILEGLLFDNRLSEFFMFGGMAIDVSSRIGLKQLLARIISEHFLER